MRRSDWTKQRQRHYQSTRDTWFCDDQRITLILTHWLEDKTKWVIYKNDSRDAIDSTTNRFAPNNLNDLNTVLLIVQIK